MKQIKEIDEFTTGDTIECSIGAKAYQIHYRSKNSFIMSQIDKEGQLGEPFCATRRGLELLIIQSGAK